MPKKQDKVAPLPVPEKYTTTNLDLAKAYGSKLSAGSAAMQTSHKKPKPKPKKKAETPKAKPYAKKGISPTLGEQEKKRKAAKGGQRPYRMAERDERNATRARLRRQNRSD